MSPMNKIILITILKIVYSTSNVKKSVQTISKMDEIELDTSNLEKLVQSSSKMDAVIEETENINNLTKINSLIKLSLSERIFH